MIDTPAIEKLLGELEALHDKATPGPYHVEDGAPLGGGDPTGWFICHPKTECDATALLWVAGKDDADHIAAAANLIPTLITTIRALMEAVEWRPIETAPRDRTPIIICVTCDGREPIVGEAYFNPEAYGGTWWWAGSADGEYADSPIEDINYGAPTLWMPLPQPPAIRSKGDA